MRSLRWVWLVLLLVLLTPLVAWAEEVAKPVWWGDVQLWEIVAAVVVFVWGLIKAKYALKKKWGDKVMEFLEMGVQKTYDEYVREMKAKAENGKLTAEMVGEARIRAWAAAKEYAKEQGVDLAKKVAAEQIPVLLTRIVSGLKKKKKD